MLPFSTRGLPERAPVVSSQSSSSMTSAPSLPCSEYTTLRTPAVQVRKQCAYPVGKVRTAPQGCERDLRVRVGRRADVDEIERGLLRQQLAPARVQPRAGRHRARRFQPGGRDVRDGDDLHVLAGEIGGVVSLARDESEPDHGALQHLSPMLRAFALRPSPAKPAPPPMLRAFALRPSPAKPARSPMLRAFALRPSPPQPAPPPMLRASPARPARRCRRGTRPAGPRRARPP